METSVSKKETGMKSFKEFICEEQIDESDGKGPWDEDAVKKASRTGAADFAEIMWRGNREMRLRRAPNTLDGYEVVLIPKKDIFVGTAFDVANWLNNHK